MNAILSWLLHAVTIFGIPAPAGVWLAFPLGVVVEGWLTRRADPRLRSTGAMIGNLLRLALAPVFGRLPIVGPVVIRFLEVVANVDLDGDGHVGDPAASPPLKVAVLLAFLALPGVVGCAAVLNQLPAIIAAVQDGELLLQTVQGFMDAIWAVKPDPVNQKRVRDAITKAQISLDAINRLAQGGEKIDQGQTDAAFADFEAAWNDLMSLVGPYGVHVGAGPRAERTASGGLMIPRPLIRTRRGAPVASAAGLSESDREFLRRGQADVAEITLLAASR